MADTVVDVPQVTLDVHAAAHGLRHIDVVKIDVEGFELAVLRGARALLTARQITWIMLEISDTTSANAGFSATDVGFELERYGYHLHEITPPGEIGRRVLGSERFPGANYIAQAHQDQTQAYSSQIRDLYKR